MSRSTKTLRVRRGRRRKQRRTARLIGLARPMNEASLPRSRPVGGAGGDYAGHGAARRTRNGRVRWDAGRPPTRPAADVVHRRAAQPNQSLPGPLYSNSRRPDGSNKTGRLIVDLNRLSTLEIGRPE